MSKILIGNVKKGDFVALKTERFLTQINRHQYLAGSCAVTVESNASGNE